MDKAFRHLALAGAGALTFAGTGAAQTGIDQPCMAGPYVVFFDWGSDRLSPQAAAVLDTIAKAYRSCANAQVTIAGHTDRDGSTQANVARSRREAEHVRDYLVTRDIPDELIKLEAFGEGRPLVKTPDGQREPQNRRAEITFGVSRAPAEPTNLPQRSLAEALSSSVRSPSPRTPGSGPRNSRAIIATVSPEPEWHPAGGDPSALGFIDVGSYASRGKYKQAWTAFVFNGARSGHGQQYTRTMGLIQADCAANRSTLLSFRFYNGDTLVYTEGPAKGYSYPPLGSMSHEFLQIICGKHQPLAQVIPQDRLVSFSYGIFQSFKN